MKKIVSEKKNPQEVPVYDRELKPCPFCGSDCLEKGSIAGIDGTIKWIACKKCGASSGLKREAVDAIAAWNLRTRGTVKHAGK